MDTLNNLKPKKIQRVIDIVEQVGLDTSDWSNYERGRKYASVNPKYCYQWAFYELDKVALFSINFKRLEQDKNRIFVVANTVYHRGKTIIEIGIEDTHFTEIARASRRGQAIRATCTEGLLALSGYLV